MERTMVDPFDAQYVNLGSVFKPVDVNSTKPTSDQPMPPYDALQVPDDVDARKSLTSRLLDLFVASSSGNFNEAQLAEMRGQLETVMPDPEKDAENFARFIQDRCHGVLEMLHLLVSWQNRGPHPSKVMDEVARLTAFGITNMDMPEPVSAFKGSERDAVMHPRVERINNLKDLHAIILSNTKAMPIVTAKYAAFSHEFDVVFAPPYRTKIQVFTNEYHTPEYLEAQWFNTLLRNLNAFDMKRSDTREQLVRLAKALREAKNATAFTTAIDTFGTPIN